MNELEKAMLLDRAARVVRAARNAVTQWEYCEEGLVMPNTTDEAARRNMNWLHVQLAILRNELQELDKGEAQHEGK